MKEGRRNVLNGDEHNEGKSNKQKDCEMIKLKEMFGNEFKTVKFSSHYNTVFFFPLKKKVN